MDNEMTGTGYITVRVATALGAVPIAGATVIITPGEFGESDIFIVRTTDAGGLTERIALKTVERENSGSPNGYRAYSTYNITVSAEGYYPKTYINVAVFDGITAMQSAFLTPLAANDPVDGDDGESFFENKEPEF